MILAALLLLPILMFPSFIFADTIATDQTLLNNNHTDHEIFWFLIAATTIVLAIIATRYLLQKKRHNDVLRGSEKRHRSLLESSPDWVWELDANAVYTYASPKIHDLLGYSVDEVIGKTPFDLMSSSEVERVRSIFTEIVSNKAPFYNLENTNTHKDGHTVVLETSGVPIIGSSGELLGYRGMDRDITQRKNNEYELRQERDFNSTVLDTAGNVIVILDVNGCIIRFNRAAEALTGYSSQEVIGKPVWELVIPEEQRPAVKNIFDSLCLGEMEIANQYENEWLTSTGERRLLDWHNSVLKDDNNKITHIVAMGYDITDRKKMESSLHEQERELAEIIDNLPSMVFLKEARDLRYVRFNSAGEQLTGINRNDIIGKNDYDFFPEEQADFFTDRDRSVLASSKLEDIPEEPIDTPTGTRTLHTRKVTIHDENGIPKYLLGVSDDITEQLESKAEQERLQRELQQAQKMESLGHLTGGIAHDFNNLLNIISGFSELSIIISKNNDDEKLTTYLQHTKDAAERATSLVSQMLSFSRKDSTKSAPLDISPVLEEEVQMLRATLPSTIEIHAEIEKDLSPILMNKTQLQQIVMNLCVNARDAMDGQGQLKIRLSLTKNMDTESSVTHKPIKGDRIELTISDSGQGINPKIIEEIFTPFFTTKDVGKGTGMGLSVVYGIIKNNGGDILVKTQPGKGSSFHLLFPPVASEKLQDIKDIAYNKKIPAGHNQNILVVDDEESMTMLMKNLLREYGYQATTFTDSTKALAEFKSQPEKFKLLISDQTMPKLTGIDLIEQLREIKPELPAILCTGFSDKISEEEALSRNIHFFNKPVVTEELIKKLAQIFS